MDDHNINEMEEMMEAPDDPVWEDDYEAEDWGEDEEDWGEDEDLDDLIDDEDEDLIPPAARDHGTLLPISIDGDVLRTGDKVQIVGDISESDKYVYIGERMHKMINDGRTYTIEETNRMGNEFIIMCGRWNWSAKNIRKLFPDKKEKKEKIFRYDPQHIDVE